EITQEVLNAAVGGIFLHKTPNQAYQLLEDKVLLKLDWAKNQKSKSSLNKIVAFADKGISNSDTDKIMARMDAMTLKMDAQYKELQSNAKKQNPILMMMEHLCHVKKKLNSCRLFKQLNLGVGTERMIFNIDSKMKHSYLKADTCFSIDVINEILEEDFDALLDEDLELKPLPDNLEYVFLEEPSFLPVIISSQVSKEKKNKLVSILKKHKQAFAWKTTNIPGICPSFCKHEIQLLDDKKPVVQKQRRLNLNMQEVVEKEIVKLLDTDIIYPIANSPWVSPIHCVPKKGGITVLTNENDELVPTRTVTGWREGIVLRHKVSSAGLEVDKAKVDVISKLPPPTKVKGSEAQAVPTNDAQVVVTFLKRLFCRFEMPKALINDKGSLEYISWLDTSKSNNYALKNTSFKKDHQSSSKCHKYGALSICASHLSSMKT
nr:reverse transcriptase domain-containing protein [Tanacetum cinerariifolium]